MNNAALIGQRNGAVKLTGALLKRNDAHGH